MKKFAARSLISDPELAKAVMAMTEKPLLENTGVPFDDYVNSFCNKLEGYGNGFVLFNRKQRELAELIKKNKEDLAKKVCTSDFKETIKKKKKKLKEKVE